MAFSVCLVIMYGVKFSKITEHRWLFATVIGILFVVGLLDVIRIAVVTIVELRKFEIRQRSRAGELMERRVKKEGDDDLPAMLKPKPKKKVIPTPPIPKAPPRFPERPTRPTWMPNVLETRSLPRPPPPPGRTATSTSGRDPTSQSETGMSPS